MLISNPHPHVLGSNPGTTMTSQRNAELSRSQSGGSGPTSPLAVRPGSGSNNRSSTTQDIDFRFLNFSHPSDAKDARTRRDVRSHVTTKQHEKQRKVVAQQALKSQQSRSQSSVSPALSLSLDRSSSGESPGLSEADASSPDTPSPLSPTASSPAYFSNPSPTPNVRINPAEVYPQEWHPYLRPVMEHYLTYMSIDLPETDATSRDQLRTSFYSLILSDRASLHALMLVAGAHWNKVRPTQPHRINLLQLQNMAIYEINQALPDGGRATSDRLIAAVAKMATYELLFGQRETFHTHMTGLQKMVYLRGGLQALGLNRLLERSLLWIDANAATITGGSLYFQPAVFPSSIGHPRADRSLFLLGLQTSQ